MQQYQGIGMSKSFMQLRTLRDVAVLALLSAAPSFAADYPKSLAEEPIPAVVTLPGTFPASWVLVHDMNFPSLLDGRVVVVDTAAETENRKGEMPAAQFANFVAASTRPEIYVAETFHSRLTRGTRTDVITIYDRRTLAVKDEIVLPGGKRGQFVSTKNSFKLTNDEKWALLFNFTPASSVSVIDLDSRKILGEVDLPGCTMIYPTGPRGFSTMCADGTMTTLDLAADGTVSASRTTKAFNDIDNDAMFMMPAMVGNTAWFVTFAGNVQGVDLAGPTATPKPKFALGAADGAVTQWRPGGWQVVTADAAGLLYVLMNPAGKEGSHKDGGTEVWVVDPVRQQRLRRIKLESPGVSIEATREAKPGLVVARPDGALDVYDAVAGTLRKTLGGSIAISPFTMSAVE